MLRVRAPEPRRVQQDRVHADAKAEELPDRLTAFHVADARREDHDRVYNQRGREHHQVAQAWWLLHQHFARIEAEDASHQRLLRNEPRRIHERTGLHNGGRRVGTPGVSCYVGKRALCENSSTSLPQRKRTLLTGKHASRTCGANTVVIAGATPVMAMSPASASLLKRSAW
eukprot:scaffold91461_cov104-Phaeocystis_antarctica.AAC.2